MERPGGGSRGFALIVVLWFLVLLAAIGTYMMANARAETALAHNLLAGARAEAGAEAAIAQAAFNLADPDPTRRWKLDGSTRHILVPGGEATVRLIDESAKINANLASAELLSGLCQALGIEQARADGLGAAIADWVQPGTTPRPRGAKQEQYVQAGRSYGPPDAPAESLDELQLVLGMTPAIFAALQPYLTIYTEAEAPDRSLASGPVLRALDIAARNQGRGGGGSAGDPALGAPAPPPTGAAAAAKPVVVTVDATARGAEGGVFVRRAVLRIDPGSPRGYVVLDWRRGESPD